MFVFSGVFALVFFYFVFSRNVPWGQSIKAIGGGRGRGFSLLETGIEDRQSQ